MDQHTLRWFRVGTLDCLAANDGTTRFDARSFFANAPEEAFAAALAAYPAQDGKLETYFHSLVIRAPGETILIDPGLGPRVGAGAGRLPDALRAAGIAPETIGSVVISHAHYDHVGGLLDSAGAPVYPNARLIVSGTEWDFLHSTAAEQGPRREMTLGARACLAPYALRLMCVADGDSIVPGVTVRAAPGHTPGQIALLIESEGARLLYVADIVAHPLHLLHPDWAIIADADAVQAIRTRYAVLGWAAAEQIPIYVHHFPPPVVCRVAATEHAWQIIESGEGE